jgi:hypothetical protein
VSLGIARVEGEADDHTGFNVWGGESPEVPATFGGKSYGIISIDGVLYMWVSPGSGPTGYDETTLHRSDDHGRSWTPADWSFTRADELVLPTILQFGRDYDGARDGFVYAYAIRLKDGSSLDVQVPGEIDLLRAPVDSLMDRDAWEFFTGLDGDTSTWDADIDAREPVFTDPAGVGWNVSVSYNAPLGRYVLCTEHDASKEGNLGIFDAPEPWGPWTTVGYYSDWEELGATFFWNFSNKWLSADGLDFTLVFTGIGDNDSWNTIRGRFDATAPPPSDGGTPDEDASAPGPDGGETGPDASPPDAAGSSDGGAVPSGDDGCGCTTTGRRSLPIWAFTILILWTGARRSRRPRH